MGKYVNSERGRTGACILWMGTKQNAGYGVRKVNGKRVLAHRKAYEDVYGPIPPGLHIDHLCRTPLCINVEHLEAVTPRENTLRGLRGRMMTHCKNGHPFSDENTVRNAKGQRRCITCRDASNTKTELRRSAERISGAVTVTCAECGATVRKGGIQMHRVRSRAHREALVG